MGSAEEEARKIAPAKSEIGHRGPGRNLFKERAFGADAVNAVPGARPDAAVLVAAKTIRVAGRNCVKHAAVAEASVIPEIKYADVSFGVDRKLSPAFSDIQSLFVRRETEAIGTRGIVGDNGQFSRTGIEPVNPGRLFRRMLSAFIVGAAAIMRSVNRIVSSLRRTTSLGPLSRRP